LLTSQQTPLYTPCSNFHLALFLYGRPVTFGLYHVVLTSMSLSSCHFCTIIAKHIS
jgi:hypothetical protein